MNKLNLKLLPEYLTEKQLEIKLVPTIKNLTMER